MTAPGSTIASEVPGTPNYYPSQPTITVNKSQFTQQDDGMYVLEVEDEYVAANATYKVGHYLKNLTGDGYELIESIDKDGVKNSVVTPEINNYAYADYDHRDENVTITGDSGQELKVYYDRRDFTLSYNVDGGTYVPAETKPYGTTIALPTTATRAGYTFGGWYTDEACTRTAGTSVTLEDNTTLYAKWNPTQVNYQIVYMIENANDDGYSYLATVTKQAATGSSITLTKNQADNYAPTGNNGLDKTNFTFKDSTTATVKADGTTVVTVRYSRNEYTITWYGSGYLERYGRWQTGLGYASLSAKYGADISAQWTATFNTPHSAYCWNFSYSDNNAKFTSLDVMPSGDKTVYIWYYTTTKTQYLNYWLENYDTSLGSKTRDGHTYGLLKLNCHPKCFF